MIKARDSENVGKDSTLKAFLLVTVLAGAWSTPLVCVSGEESRAKWRIEVGPSYRAEMNAEVTGSSRSRNAVFEATQPSSSIPALAEGHPQDVPNPDDITAIGNRDFDNGYVHTDAITPFDSLTVNFGYVDNSQFDASTSTLTFHRTAEVKDSELLAKGLEYRKTVKTKETPSDDENDFSGAGVKANILCGLPSLSGVDLAVLVGVRGYFGMDNTVEISNFSQTISESKTPYSDIYSFTDSIRDQYVFPTNGLIPAAPYDNPNGNPGGDPLISNLPSRTTREITHSGVTSRNLGASQLTSWETKNHIAVDTDINMFQFAVGGEMSSELGSHFALHLRPSLLVNLLDIEITRREELTAFYTTGDTKPLGNWHERQGEETVRLGAALEAGLTCKITQSWFAGVSAGYEWIDDITMGIGPNTVAFDLSGFSTSATIGVNF
jgi:hypothetical protein